MVTYVCKKKEEKDVLDSNNLQKIALLLYISKHRALKQMEVTVRNGPTCWIEEVYTCIT